LDLSKSGTLAQDKDYSRYLDVDYESGYMLLMENGKSSPVKQITIEKNSFIEKALEFDKVILLSQLMLTGLWNLQKNPVLNL